MIFYKVLVVHYTEMFVIVGSVVARSYCIREERLFLTCFHT